MSETEKARRETKYMKNVAALEPTLSLP